MFADVKYGVVCAVVWLSTKIGNRKTSFELQGSNAQERLFMISLRMQEHATSRRN